MALSPINTISICAGVGGLDLGLHIAVPESRTVLYIEREIHAAQVLAARMEEGSLAAAPIFSDLLAFDGNPWRGCVHAIIAGLPCQPYSVAGKQRGHDDERAIWPAFIRVVGEVLPLVVFLENVPAFLRYFRPVGDELQRLGYTVEEPLLITASSVGASHRRERFFALAYRGGRGFRIGGESSRRDGFADGGEPFVADAEHAERRPEHAQHRNPYRRDGSGREGSELGNPDQPGSQGRSLGEHGADERITGPAGYSELADADETGSCKGSGDDSGTGFGNSPESESGTSHGELADTDRTRPTREASTASTRWTPINDGRSELPLFAPGPSDPRWPAILAEFPWLAPALSEEEAECLLRSVADEFPFSLAASRTDGLRACGNAVVPIQATFGFIVLAKRAGLMG